MKAEGGRMSQGRRRPPSAWEQGSGFRLHPASGRGEDGAPAPRLSRLPAPRGPCLADR